MFYKISPAGLPLTSLCFALIASATVSGGPTSSGYPGGFGYKGQISSGVYERSEVCNNRDGPTGKFYVRPPHWRCWDSRRSRCCSHGHVSVAGPKDFHRGGGHEPK